jgi:hypothetical protein
LTEIEQIEIGGCDFENFRHLEKGFFDIFVKMQKQDVSKKY